MNKETQDRLEQAAEKARNGGSSHEESVLGADPENTERARQRRIPTDNIGCNRRPIIPEEESGYTPPDLYPDAAKRYLSQLARIGTMTGACKLAGNAPKRVYEWRTQLEGFQDEEEAAKDAVTDYIEENLFDAVFTEAGMARVKAAELALKANRGEKYNTKQKVEHDGNVEVTWIDLLKQQDSE